MKYITLIVALLISANIHAATQEKLKLCETEYFLAIKIMTDRLNNRPLPETMREHGSKVNGSKRLVLIAYGDWRSLAEPYWYLAVTGGAETISAVWNTAFATWAYADCMRSNR